MKQFFLINLFISFFMTYTQASPFQFAAFGDSPYIIPEGEEMFKKMRDQVNQANPLFSVHVGDIKGGGLCSREYFQNTIKLFNEFKNPLIYTPGDNEWTDCHRKKNGSGDPLLALKEIRELFFLTHQSFGKTKMALKGQNESLEFSKYSENKKWIIEGIYFATVHVVGSNNNFQPEINGAENEFRERNKANIAWIQNIFKEARENHAKGIVLISHADMNFPGYYKRLRKEDSQEKGYDRYIEALTKEVLKFKNPVLNIVGDSHSFKIDQPLRFGPKNKFVINNYLRLIVFGFPEVRSSLITVKPNGRDVFDMFSVTPQKAIAWEYQ